MSTEAPKKWTKRDMITMRAALDTLWVLNRPHAPAFGGGAKELEAAASHVRAELAKPNAKREVVLAYLRSSMDRVGRDYRGMCETIGNQIVRFSTYGGGDHELVPADELVARFTKLAREQDAAHARLEALVLRVHHEGIPPEVEAYDPTEKK